MEQLPQKNEESQKEILTPFLIPNTASGVKIRDLSDSKPLKTALMYAWKVTDLKEIPEGLDYDILIDFITKSYGGYCAPEIRLAFELGCRGDLNVEMKHYQAFTPLYLGTILKAYSELRAKTLQNAPKTPLKEIKQSSEEVQAFWKRFLFDPYDKLKAGEPYLFDEYESADRYSMLEILGIPMSNKEITLKYSNLHSVIKGNGEQARKKTNKLRRELKAELFKSWIIEKAFEGVQIKEDILNRL